MPMPALLTSPCTAPKRPTAALTVFWQSDHWLTSQSTGNTLSGNPSRCAVPSRSRISFWLEGRSAAATRTPARASPSVMARPMPRAAPVTITAMLVGSGVALFASACDMLTSCAKVLQPGRLNCRQATVFAATVVKYVVFGVREGRHDVGTPGRADFQRRAVRPDAVPDGRRRDAGVRH